MLINLNSNYFLNHCSFSLNSSSDLPISKVGVISRKFTSKVPFEVSPENATINTVVTYEQINDLSNLKKGLEITKSSVAAGFGCKTLPSFSTDKLEYLSKELISQEYEASHSKDSVVQATILMLLQPILEKVFRDSSMGLRP